jgi:hypothetical protein
MSFGVLWIRVAWSIGVRVVVSMELSEVVEGQLEKRLRLHLRLRLRLRLHLRLRLRLLKFEGVKCQGEVEW